MKNKWISKESRIRLCQLEAINKIHLVFMKCMAMFGSGVLIGTANIRQESREILRGQIVVRCVCCVVVLGSSMHGSHARLVEPATYRRSAIIAEGSDWLEVKYYYIFYTRCAGWSSVFVKKLRSNFLYFQFSGNFHNIFGTSPWSIMFLCIGGGAIEWNTLASHSNNFILIRISSDVSFFEPW